MLESYLVDQCELIGTTVDDFGQQISGATQTLPCRWRDITTVRRGANMDNSDADSMVWLKADAPVGRGSILLYDGDHYQVEKITKAKRLGETQVQFIKCEVNITNIGVS